MYNFEEVTRVYVIDYLVENYTTEEIARAIMENPDGLAKTITDHLSGALAEAVNGVMDDIYCMTINGEPWK